MELYPGYLEDHFNIHKLSRLPLANGGGFMTSASVGGPMGIYDYDRRARQQPFAAAWGAEQPFRPDAVFAAQNPVTGASAPGPGPAVGVVDAMFVSKVEDDVPVEDAPSSDSFGPDQDDARPNDKALRRLAQNREAARKSRLRKKAYIQTLESSKMKLALLEQELTHVRRQQQGVFVRGSIGESAMGLTPPPPAFVDPAAAAFELDYARWVEEQSRHAGELRAALQSTAPDAHLLALVDAGLAHYDALFRLKSLAARRDAFLVLSGAWRAPAERFFLWIGGFRPSEVIATLAPQLADPPLSEQQEVAVRALRLTARQLEDALSQGLDKLQQTLNEALVTVVDDDGDGGGGGGWGGYAAAAAAAAQKMDGAVEKLAGLPGFVDNADHLRQQTLRNMRKILAPRQAARGMLALADYCQRLRALGSLWAARPRESA